MIKRTISNLKKAFSELDKAQKNLLEHNYNEYSIGYKQLERAKDNINSLIDELEN